MILERINRGSAAALGFLLVSVIFAVLSLGVKVSHPVPNLDADRGAERAKMLSAMQAEEEKALNTAVVIDAGHGVVRLPIDRAMELAAQAWKNPAAARADLKMRAEKAAAELPKAPAKPSAFE